MEEASSSRFHIKLNQLRLLDTYAVKTDLPCMFPSEDPLPDHPEERARPHGGPVFAVQAFRDNS